MRRSLTTIGTVQERTRALRRLQSARLAMRLAEDAKKLSLKVGVLGDILREADHYAAEAGREYSGVSIGPEELHEIQLAPFKAAIDAGVGALMPSFNTVNGRPVTADKTLLTDLLRQQWTFNGVVLTDYTAINELQRALTQ